MFMMPGLLKLVFGFSSLNMTELFFDLLFFPENFLFPETGSSTLSGPPPLLFFNSCPINSYKGFM